MTDHYANKEYRKSLRQKILGQRRQISKELALESGNVISQELSKHPHFSSKKVVGSYLSLGGEVSTDPINKFFLDNHYLALPVINVHLKGQMDFYSYKDNDSLVENRFHILEPNTQSASIIIPDAIDALIVPLVAFDKRGNRLGMGGGYYDRILKKISAQCLLIGIAYDFQLLDEVPVESWDMPLDEVITPTEHYVFN